MAISAKLFLKSWLRDSALALSSCVSDSHSFCRLQQLVGASPVLYGVPLAYSAKSRGNGHHIILVNY